ncbi:MAG: LPS export ABC transporter periplasmic protein LptC [Halanaerobiaceae bacterium]
MRNNKTILLIICTLLIIIGVFFSLSYQPDINKEESNTDVTENREERPSNQFRDIQLVFFNSDKTIAWYMNSSRVENYSDRNLLDMSIIEIDAHSGSSIDNLQIDNNILKKNTNTTFNEGDILYSIVAERSTYNTQSGHLDLLGPINIQKESILMKTDHLEWVEGDSLLSGSGGININSPDFNIKGEKMAANFSLNIITVTGNDNTQANITWEKGSESD